MPRIPVVNQPDTSLNALPGTPLQSQNIQAPQSLNQNVVIPDNSNAFAKTTNALGKWAQEAKERADKTALLEAESAIDEWEMNNLYGKDGALNTQGKSAFDLAPTVGVNFNQKISEVESSLSNADQKTAFRQWATQRKFAVRKSLLEHEAVQFRQYSAAQQEARTEIGIQKAIMSGNPRDIALAEQDVVDAIEANVAGLPAEAIELKKMEATTRLYSGLIDNTIDDNPAQARALFKANKDKISPTLHDDIKKKLEAGTLKQSGQNKFDSLLVKHGDNFNTLYDEAYAIKDAEMRDEVLGNIRAYQRDVSATQQAQDLSEAEEMSLYIENKTPFEALPVQKRIEWDSKRGLYAELYEEKTGAISIMSDAQRTTWYVEFKSSSNNPQAFAQKYTASDVLRHAPRDKRQEALEIFADVTNGRGETNKEIRDFRSVEDVVKQVFDSTGRDKEEYAAFVSAFERQVRMAQSGRDVPLPMEQQKSIAATLALKPDSYWMGSVADALVNLEQFDVQGIPQDQLPLYAAGMGDFNIPITDSNLDMFKTNPERFVAISGATPEEINTVMDDLLALGQPLTRQNFIQGIYGLKRKRDEASGGFSYTIPVEEAVKKLRGY